MFRTAPLIIAAILTSSCGSSENPAPPVQNDVIVRSEAQQQLFDLSDLNRAIALKRAIYDAGYNCKRVTRSGFVGAYKNLDMWMASCADGRDWAIFAGPDGSAQVRDCKDVTGLGLPQCTSKEQPGKGSAEAG